MTGPDIFVSVGGTATTEQETFVRSVEDRLRSEGCIPHTVGRNTFSAEAPLKAVEELMSRCAGTVVIALERSFFEDGLEKRGGTKVQPLKDIKLPTPWNHIEAAMSYQRGLPNLVLVEEGLKSEGLLEHGHDWFVQTVQLGPASLTSMEFNGVFASWKEKVLKRIQLDKEINDRDQLTNPADQTIGQLITGLKPSQLWSMLGAFGAIVASAFALGANLLGG